MVDGCRAQVRRGFWTQNCNAAPYADARGVAETKNYLIENTLSSGMCGGTLMGVGCIGYVGDSMLLEQRKFV